MAGPSILARLNKPPLRFFSGGESGVKDRLRQIISRLILLRRKEGISPTDSTQREAS